MARKKNKNIREKGKIRLSEYFKELEEGQKVAIVQERTIPNNIPLRITGLTGNIVGSQGEYKIVDLMDGNKKKRFIIHPIHLKVLK
jgi:ribosomal protein L21E